MIQAIVIDDELRPRQLLIDLLQENCPNINVLAEADSAERGVQLIENLKPDLIFLDVAMPKASGFDLLKRKPNNLAFEVIFVTGFNDYAIQAISFCAIGYVTKPIKEEALVEAVKNASQRIHEKRDHKRNLQLLHNLTNQGSDDNIIGIPTQEGLELIAVKNIIRCESDRKHTTVFIQNQDPLVSSYNIGKFKTFLESYQFFSVHKSHLINLRHVRRYHREGLAYMSDNTAVPVSKIRRKEFLEQINRF